MLADKTILVTGGTGSFGQKFVEVVLKDYDVHKLIVYSRNESIQYTMQNKFDDDRLRFFIGDVRDINRLKRSMTGVDIVVHASALKHVPICEYNPIEAVHTNIMGAVNVIDAAIDIGVERVMSVGSDKEVQPLNLYGATKLVAEKLFVQANSYTKGIRPIFSCTRYGNVLGSSGSVVNLFLEQRDKGQVTITDDRMTRFWLTLEQGVRFVIDSIGKMKGGEIFIPKIPSMRIVDVASVVAPEAKQVIIGIRPGEKLHETLLTEDESRHTLEFSNYFIVEPEYPYWKDIKLEYDNISASNGGYTSDNNKEWLDSAGLRKMLKLSGVDINE